MLNRMLFSSLLVCGTVLFSFAATAAAAEPVRPSLYHLEMLPAFAKTHGFQRSEAIDINDRSEIVGFSNLNKSSHAFIFSKGTMSRLLSDQPLITFSLPRAVNNAGIVVGSATSNGESLGFRTSNSGPTELLKPLDGDNESTVTAINDTGSIVGLSRNSDKTTAVYAEAAFGSTLQPLALPQDSKTCRARAITSANSIYGDCETVTRESYAVVWTTPAQAIQLAKLEGADSSRVYAAPHVSISGTLAVGSAVVNGLATATRWTTDGQVLNLGTLPNDDSSEANAVNETGLAVGYSSDQTIDSFRAVVFENGLVLDLNSVVDSLGEFEQLTFANGVNGRGEIVGIGNLKTGGIRGFLLTPISIPK